MLPPGSRRFLPARLGALAVLIALLAPAGASAHATLAARTLGAPSGGAGLGGPGPAPVPRVLHVPSRHRHGKWLKGFTITEYWPAPESWFVGQLVSGPGLSGKHRIDWLYSAAGVSMQGEGLGLDGQMYHLQSPGDGGWVTATGKPTSPSDGWSAGSPFWRAGGYWRSALGAVTFPLKDGGWFAGAGKKYLPLPGITFAAGPSLPLTFYGSVAVDPRVIPLGSLVYIPAYRSDGHGGWFVAQDTGGGVLGHHIDVFRPPPPNQHDSGRYLTGTRVLVIRPRH